MKKIWNEKYVVDNVSTAYIGQILKFTHSLLERAQFFWLHWDVVFYIKLLDQLAFWDKSQLPKTNQYDLDYRLLKHTFLGKSYNSSSI
jgi:hypothetical protein